MTLRNHFIQPYRALDTLLSTIIRTIFENSKPVKLLHTIDIQYAEVFEALVTLDSNKDIHGNRQN